MTYCRLRREKAGDWSSRSHAVRW